MRCLKLLLSPFSERPTGEPLDVGADGNTSSATVVQLVPSWHGLLQAPPARL